MIRRLRSSSPALIVAILALVAAVSGVSVAGVAVIPSAKAPSTVHACVKSKSGNLRVASKCRRGERGINLQSGAAKSLTGPQGAAGSQGASGSQGPQGENGGRGPSLGDGKQILNVNDISCGEDVVVGSQALTVTEPSRIWIHGQGNLRVGNSSAADYGLWLRLRNAGNTTTLAVSTRAWGEQSAYTYGDLALSSGGLLLSGDDPDASDPSAPAFVAPAGTYTLQLAVIAGNVPCAGPSLPDFGFNQGNSMGYVLLGTG